ncbi:hypothetical protein H5410_060652, partial [Solanum commersonii]
MVVASQVRMGSEIGRGFYDRKSAYQTSYSVSLGDDYYECGKTGYYVEIVARPWCNSALGFAITTSGVQDKVGHGPFYALIGRSEAKASSIPSLD